MLAPFGNFFNQKARKVTSSESIMFIRSIVTLPVILAVIILFKIDFSYSGFKSSLLILLINGILLFGVVKILWLEGIHRISVTKANALSAAGPFLTIIFAWIILKDSATAWQIIAIIPMFLGVLLLSKQSEIKAPV